MTLHELLDTGYRQRQPAGTCYQIDAEIAFGMYCPKCGARCVYEGWHKNGSYIALAVCRDCGHEEEF